MAEQKKRTKKESKRPQEIDRADRFGMAWPSTTMIDRDAD
jgi:hypothetical protein